MSPNTEHMFPKVNGNMHERQTRGGNVTLVVNDHHMAYGSVKVVKQENPRYKFPNGYRLMDEIKTKQRYVIRAKSNTRQKKNVCDN